MCTLSVRANHTVSKMLNKDMHFSKWVTPNSHGQIGSVTLDKQRCFIFVNKSANTSFWPQNTFFWIYCKTLSPLLYVSLPSLQLFKKVHPFVMLRCHFYDYLHIALQSGSFCIPNALCVCSPFKKKDMLLSSGCVLSTWLLNSFIFGCNLTLKLYLNQAHVICL